MLTYSHFPPIFTQIYTIGRCIYSGGKSLQFKFNMRSEHSEGTNRTKERPRFRVKQWSGNLKEDQSEEVKIHIYNFFITEGHYDLANTFAKQSQLNIPLVKEEAVTKRLLIKNFIKTNDFESAIKEIEAFESQQKDEEKQYELIFTLKCLKVIYLIKQRKIEEAITSAKELLIPYVKKKFQWIERVEQVMSLIAYINQKQCINKELLQVNYKNKVADDVNSFLLGNKSRESLKILLNLGKWLQKRLEMYAQFPHLNPWSHDLFHM